MFKKLRGLTSSDIAIDLGTANTLIYMEGQQVVLDEPSVVAVLNNKHGKTVMATGTEAKEMMGRCPPSVSVIRPLKDGVIANFEATEKMLLAFIKKAHDAKLFSPAPRVLVCVPCQATQVECNAIRKTTTAAGARAVFLLPEPMAAAIGAGIEVNSAKGSMVVDIGGGTTEIAVISLNGLVYAESVKIGGDAFDEAIIQYVRRKGFAIAEATAEKIKKTIAWVKPLPEQTPKSLEIAGTLIEEGVPRHFTLNSDDILKALRDPVEQLISGVRRALEKAPPELAADVFESGITLTGGGALIKGLPELICERTGVQAVVADDPLTCVARGGGLALEMVRKNPMLFDVQGDYVA